MPPPRTTVPVLVAALPWEVTTEMLVPEYLAEVPAGAKLVYLVLEDEGRVTAREVVEETGLSRSAVTQSVQRLQDAGADVSVTRDLGDVRYTAYELHAPGGASN